MIQHKKIVKFLDQYLYVSAQKKKTLHAYRKKKFNQYTLSLLVNFYKKMDLKTPKTFRQS